MKTILGKTIPVVNRLLVANRAPQLHRQEAFLIPQMSTTLAGKFWDNHRSSVVLPVEQTSDERGTNENGNCAKPAPAIDQNLGHLPQFFVLGFSKL